MEHRPAGGADEHEGERDEQRRTERKRRQGQRGEHRRRLVDPPERPRDDDGRGLTPTSSQRKASITIERRLA